MKRLKPWMKMGMGCSILIVLTLALALVETTNKAQAKVVEYEIPAAKTATGNDQLNDSAGKFMEQCYGYLASQNEAMRKEISDGAEPAIIRERIVKLTMMNDIINLGNATRLAGWKAQSLHDPEIVQEIARNFNAIDKMLAELEATTPLVINPRQIEKIRKTAHAYQSSMNNVLSGLMAREKFDVKRAKTRDNVFEPAGNSARTAMEQTGKVAGKAVFALSSSLSITIGGIIAALVLGLSVAFFMTHTPFSHPADISNQLSMVNPDGHRRPPGPMKIKCDPPRIPG